MIPAQTIVAGSAEGPLLVLEAPLSFWGGVDPETGRIIERRHPQFGVSLARQVLALPAVKGSSSGSSILAEILRNGSGPSGIVLGAPDGILATGAIVAQRLYGIGCPVVCIAPEDWQTLCDSRSFSVAATDERAELTAS